ncbi:ASCH domain-containing protein [Glaciibacter flavus]|uniref:ASCH domain-containing protein n=1 Tax=Orlajensenia flava TaxID=2565934 RepID=A0A4S4FWM4_9MICO|nr:ASCH domain-containing protein [Glaciibacter flavus]THG34036.1 ASCH domain-containing protein [Glaciibacter flavus]
MDELPVFEFASQGQLREKLVAAIVAGEKTATSSLAVAYASAGEPLPQVGQRGTVIDSAGTRRAVIETTAVEVSPLSEVPLAHAVAEGEGYADVAAWRAAHTKFWSSRTPHGELGPNFRLDDSTLIVLERFTVVLEAR